MKNFLKASASTAILVAFLATSAHAADLGGSYKDPAGPDASFDAPKVNWTGFYIGGSVGYGNANHNLTVQDYFKDFCNDGGVPDSGDKTRTLENINGTTAETANGFKPTCETKIQNGVAVPETSTRKETFAGQSEDVANLDGLNSHGIVGDLRVGADLQRGRFVFGVFGSYGLNAMETEGNISLGGGDTAGFNIEKGDEWSLGARAGILVNPRTLAYALVAYTETEYDFTVRGGDETASKTVDFSGITVGGGVEFALTNNVFLGIEGTHTFYGEETLLDDYAPACNTGTRLVDEIGETKVMGTLKIKLNSGLPNFTD